MKTSWAIVKDRALWLNSIGKSIWRLAFGRRVQRWRTGGAGESFNVQRPCSRSILEISPSPYFHLTALTNAQAPKRPLRYGKAIEIVGECYRARKALSD